MTSIENTSDQNIISVLHVFNDPKFSNGLFPFLLRNGFDLQQHYLYHYRCSEGVSPSFGMRHCFVPNFWTPQGCLTLLSALFRSEKIILHSIASPYLLLWLILFPGLNKKVYWNIWGKDLYFFRVLNKKRLHHYVYELARRIVLKRVRTIITDNLGDYDLARLWYGSQARLIRSFMYPSNLYHANRGQGTQPARVMVQVGNSGDYSNNHIRIMQSLLAFRERAFELFVPLAYGEPGYVNEVMTYGQQHFGSLFHGYTELIPLQEYQEIQSNVSIALFGHERQQGMGNIVTLIGMGKKVYLNRHVTTYQTLSGIGLTVFDLAKLDMQPIDPQVAEANRHTVMTYFSEENLVKQWKEILDSSVT